MTNKMTKREMFLEIRTYLTEQHHLDFIDHELELLDRRQSSKANRVNAKQVENVGIKNALVEAMEVNRWYTISELANEIEAVKDLSNQKISALLKQLVDTEVIQKRYEKRKAYFAVVVE